MNKKTTAPAAPPKRGGKNEVVEEEPLPESGCDIFNAANGGRYEGEWKRFDGVIKRHGHGVYSTEEIVYEGDFSEDVFHGDGVLKFTDGMCYQGQFKNGRINGEGEMLFLDGSRYKGQWRNGRMHGIGTYFTIDNQQWTGTWCHGMSSCPIFPQMIPEVNEEEEEEEMQDYPM
ncbi:hypothetical protein TRFO_30276 [Tritrichomonas foetus]|uniref:Uncharacterized protein n=1 Tax=Tritrichomonas foetus TaxID=1144522 RepID=A0A1J4JYE4_9EUKA|nr:hypothetical protein TRFO_30276 [Tritrichomonas foetus]|eukprot:OHT02548.1 hypothetical protein TRFO_30276 [Tritrichomonas foetus]